MLDENHRTGQCLFLDRIFNDTINVGVRMIR